MSTARIRKALEGQSSKTSNCRKHQFFSHKAMRYANGNLSMNTSVWDTEMTSQKHYNASLLYREACATRTLGTLLKQSLRWKVNAQDLQTKNQAFSNGAGRAVSSQQRGISGEQQLPKYGTLCLCSLHVSPVFTTPASYKIGMLSCLSGMCRLGSQISSASNPDCRQLGRYSTATVTVRSVSQWTLSWSCIIILSV